MSHELRTPLNAVIGFSEMLEMEPFGPLGDLVSNAIKFTPASGRVELAAAAGDSGLTVTVSDTGIGMAPEDVPKAFERFRQIDSRLSRKFDGAGLGLPLARDLVELHGGRLTLQSVPGVGTIAEIFFPSNRLACGVAQQASRDIPLSPSPHGVRDKVAAA